MGDICGLENRLKREFPELADISLGNRNGTVFVSSIKVKSEEQGRGIGSKVLYRIKEFATKHKLPITLCPEPDRGKKEALTRFYKENGFKKCKDSRYTSMFGPTLIWEPK